MPGFDLLAVVKDWAIIIAGVVALVSLVSAVAEARLRNLQQRAENFILMRRRFLDSPEYQRILNLLPEDDPRLAEFTIQERRNFAAYFEEVALLVNSGLLTPGVASYMYGPYVLMCFRSEHFWTGLDKMDHQWLLLRDFVRKMEHAESRPWSAPHTLRF